MPLDYSALFNAIRDALKTLRAKPYTWTPIKAGGYFPSEAGVPAGEEWEVYADNSTTSGVIYIQNGDQQMKFMTNTGLEFGAGPVSGSIAYDNITPRLYVELSLASRGFRMTGGERLFCAQPFLVRWRVIT